VHHRDAVGDGERLLLIVRYVERRDAELFLQLADLAAHLDAELGVEIGERLVEQQHLGLDDEAAGDRDALELAARELMRPALLVALEMDEGESARHPLADLGGRHASRLQAVGDVAGDGVVGENRVVLEHHAGVAPVRRQPVDARRTEMNAAGIELAESRDHAQKRGLAAPGGTEQGEELAVGDIERDAAHGVHGAEAAVDRGDADGGHGD